MPASAAVRRNILAASCPHKPPSCLPEAKPPEGILHHTPSLECLPAHVVTEELQAWLPCLSLSANCDYSQAQQAQPAAHSEHGWAGRSGYGSCALHQSVPGLCGGWVWNVLLHLTNMQSLRSDAEAALTCHFLAASSSLCAAPSRCKCSHVKVVQNSFIWV